MLSTSFEIECHRTPQSANKPVNLFPEKFMEILILILVTPCIDMFIACLFLIREVYGIFFVRLSLHLINSAENSLILYILQIGGLAQGCTNSIINWSYHILVRSHQDILHQTQNVYWWVNAKRCNSIANALELSFSCTNPSISYGEVKSEMI